MTDWISYADMIVQTIPDKSISQDDIYYADQLVQHLLANSDSIVFKSC